MSIWSRIERGLSGLADLVPDEFRIELARARSLIEKGELDEAEPVVEKLIEARPESVGAHTLHGVLQFERGDIAGARAAFDRALAADGQAPEALLGRGQSCLAQGDLAEALNAFRAAIDAAGGDREILALAYRGLGVSHRRAGDLDKAIRELRKAVAEAPRDGLALAALGDALLDDPDTSSDEARRHLDKAARLDQPPALAFLGLGRIALAEADAPRAAEQFARALEIAERSGAALERVDAVVGQGDAALRAGEIERAGALFASALALAPRRSDVHARLGEVESARSNPDAALASFGRALELGAGPQVRRRALDTAIEAGDLDRAVDLANQTLADDPRDPHALLARGLALARDRQFEPARATFREILSQRELAAAHLALADVTLAEDDSPEAGARAADEALAALALEPADERARRVLATARERERGSDPVGDAGPAVETIYSLALALHRLALRRGELSGLAGEIARAASDFDQPLLVTVMGEFSSGKSSFVNAFIGEEVAPTGITPTTATINVVKHGRERGGRIIYRDGHVESLEWKDVFSTLRELGPERARKVSTVEILLPREELERICLVDTPGLNSILPEHESVARGFIARADAVVWVFTAGQAGKASERAALESIRGEGKRVLGVLNKIDQLSPGDVAEVIKHVESELGELVEVVVPISARRAMAHASLAAGATDDGNWSAIEDALEERFFARARELKLQAAARRLGTLIGSARELAGARRDVAAAAAAAIRAAAERAAADRDAFVDTVVARERRHMATSAAALCRRAAREVLELVTPRKLPFGSHKATPADRDYLIALLESGYEAVIEPSRRRVAADLRAAGERAIAGLGAELRLIGADPLRELERALVDSIRLVDAQVFFRCQAYLRGYLRGGYVASFFRQDLPKIDLEEDAVYHALFRDSPDLDAQIALPLANAGYEALDAISDRLAHLAAAAEVLALDVELGALDELDAIDRLRGEVAAC